MAALTSFQGLRAIGIQKNDFKALSKCNNGAKYNMTASLPVLKFDGEKAGEVELDLKVAKPETAKAVVHRAVITQLQNRRRGTASTLTRAEVRGGGKKPYKQKGTGNARLGSTRTPLRPGGGVVFGPKPKDWSIKINKKENRLALSTAIQNAAVNMTVVEDFDENFSAPKTKDFVAALKRWGVDAKEDYALYFSAEISEAVNLSARNIKKLKLINPRTLNIYDVLRADKLIVTKSGLEYLTERYSKEGFSGLYKIDGLIEELESKASAQDSEESEEETAEEVVQTDGESSDE